MTLENIYYIGQTIAVIVIVVTLFAVLHQARQTQRIARAQLSADIWMRAGALGQGLYDSPEKAEFNARALAGREPLSDSERLRFLTTLGLIFGPVEGAMMLDRRGLVEPILLERMESVIRPYLRSPAVRDWVKRIGPAALDPVFLNRLNEMIAAQDAERR